MPQPGEAALKQTQLAAWPSLLPQVLPRLGAQPEAPTLPQGALRPLSCVCVARAELGGLWGCFTFLESQARVLDAVHVEPADPLLFHRGQRETWGDTRSAQRRPVPSRVSQALPCSQGRAVPGRNPPLFPPLKPLRTQFSKERGSNQNLS